VVTSYLAFHIPFEFLAEILVIISNEDLIYSLNPTFTQFTPSYMLAWLSEFSLPILYKLRFTPICFLTSPSFHHRHFHYLFSFVLPSPASSFSNSMSTSCLDMFKNSSIDGSKIIKLVNDHLLPPCAFSNGSWLRMRGSLLQTPSDAENVL
jgi:hypothetical protein